MAKRRAVISLTFSTDMDMIPGWGHEIEDWTNLVNRALMQQSHYNPSVEIHSAEARPMRFDNEKGWTLDAPAAQAAE